MLKIIISPYIDFPIWLICHLRIRVEPWFPEAGADDNDPMLSADVWKDWFFSLFEVARLYDQSEKRAFALSITNIVGATKFFGEPIPAPPAVMCDNPLDHLPECDDFLYTLWNVYKTFVYPERLVTLACNTDALSENLKLVPNIKDSCIFPVLYPHDADQTGCFAPRILDFTKYTHGQKKTLLLLSRSVRFHKHMPKLTVHVVDGFVLPGHESWLENTSS